jgi:SAM-dependent methyltransferase
MSNQANTPCPACESTDRHEFYYWPGLPVNSCLLLESHGEAVEFPRNDLRLVHCHACGFIANDDFVPGLNEYSDRYEETQAFSPHFVTFADTLAKTWVQKYDLQDKTVVEIGCGKGEFLAAMARHGIGSGIGIDPGVHPERLSEEESARLQWITGWFPEDLPDLSDAAAVVCRHTLEHIGPVRHFLDQIRAAMGPDSEAVVLFELPDALRVLREGAFWDTYYEHCSYFTTGSLARLFLRCGFDVLGLEKAYDDQYLLIEARPLRASESPTWQPDDDLADVAVAVEHYRGSVTATTAHWRHRVAEVASAGGVVVAWGGGSKAVSFLAALGDEAAHVSAVVDVNPFKHHHYLAGSGMEVIAPSDLPDITPDLVVVMNPVYLDEIRADLARLGLGEVAVEAL